MLSSYKDIETLLKSSSKKFCFEITELYSVANSEYNCLIFFISNFKLEI